MARYRKIEVAVWNDDRFCELTPAKPNGQTLWLYLLTGPRTTTFPGLVVARDAVIASDLRWTIEGFREAFREVSEKGMAKACWKAGVVVLPRALLDSLGEPRDTSRPESPNVIKSWAKSWDEVPACSLKDEYLRALESFTKGLGEAFHKAFLEGFRKALAKASAHPSLNQDTGYRNRIQEQDPLPLPAAGSEPPTQDKKRIKKPATPGHAEAKARWFAFWQSRHGQSPTWGAKQAALLNGLLGPHGLAEVLRRIDLLERSQDQWHRTWDFALFASNSDRLLGRAVNSNVSTGRVEPHAPDEYPEGEVAL